MRMRPRERRRTESRLPVIYLDHNATTPVLPEALEAMLPWLGPHYGNPSSVHRAGRLARQAIDTAREQVAALVGAQPGEVIFTSGGTEANNLALGLAASLPGPLITAATEHSAVLEPALARRQAGDEVVILPVDAEGRVAPEELAAVLRPRALVSLMWANNETGVIHDLAALGGLARESGAIVHSDAVQAAGKLAVDFSSAEVDMLSLSAHKIYGPKGVGALIRRRSVALRPMQRGGGHEHHLRAGTENLAGIVGFGVAAERAAAACEQRAEHARALRDQLESGLRALAEVRIVAPDAPRVSNTCQFTVAGFHSEALLMALDKRDIAVASGSACHAGTGKPTHVLMAMGYDESEAHGAIRVSVGEQNNAQDIATFLTALRDILHQPRPAFDAGLFGA